MVEKGKSGKLSTVMKVKRGVASSQRSHATATRKLSEKASRIERHGHGKGDESSENVLGKCKHHEEEATAEEKEEIAEEKDKPITKDISRLAIHEKDLRKIKRKAQGKKKNRQEEEKILKIVIVKKTPRISNLKSVTVLKRVRPDAEVKPIDYTDYAGPRFDVNGKFLEHSILGTLEDFKQEALRRGEYGHLFIEAIPKEKKTRQRRKPYESYQFRQWEKYNKDWQRSHSYLSEKLGRPVEDLLMRTPNLYCQRVNQRMLVDTAMDLREFSSGERRRTAQFYKLQDSVGEHESIKSTLKKCDTEDIQPSEVCGMPRRVKDEKGSDAWDIERLYPAYYTPYLHQQYNAAEEAVAKLYPHFPNVQGHGGIKNPQPELQETDELCVTNAVQKPPNREEDMKKFSVSESMASQGKITVHTHIDFGISEDKEEKINTNENKVQSKDYEIKGPALRVRDLTACWEGPERSREGQIGIQVSVLFDGVVDERIQQQIVVENVGSTLLHYEWTRIPATNTFCLVKPRIRRFFFLTEGGVLPPGQKLFVPVLFKSSTVGIFYESWRLDTNPLLLNGASILFHLKAVVRDPWNYRKDIKDTEEKLIHNKSLTIVTEIVSKLVDSIVTPEPRASPISLYKSVEDIFREENPMLFYHCSKLRYLESIFMLLPQHLPQLEEIGKKPFSVENLRKLIVKMTSLENEDMVDTDLSALAYEPEEDWDYMKRKFLWRYVRVVDSMSFKPILPYTDMKMQNFQNSLHLMQSTIDKFCDTVYFVGEKMNLPLKSDEDEVEELDKFEKRRNKKSLPSAESSRIKSKRMSIQKDTDKSVLSPTPTGKESRSAKRGKKVSPSTMVMDQAESPKMNEGFFPFNTSELEPAKLNSFREALYFKTYGLLQDLAENIALVHLEQQNENPYDAIHC